MHPKVLITGVNGMLGWELSRYFRNLWGESRVVGVDRSLLDIVDKNAVTKILGHFKPTVVLNAAAYTNVDGAESERAKAFAANATGPQNLVMGCEAIGARLVHFSTDQVFDGKADYPRREDEPTAPANAYAESKLAGETAVLSYPRALVLRVQWLYGEKKDRFTTLRGKTTFSPFADQFGAPAWTLKIAETVGVLLERETTGLFHFSYDDYASWADVFGFVREELGLGVRLEPRRTADLHLPANRPLFSVLSNHKLREALGVSSLGSWREPLRAFLKIADR